MVRLKHRYLLINILYPLPTTTLLTSSTEQVPDLIEFHAPTPTKLRDFDLRQLIIDGVSELFGDYGVGKISGSIKGTSFWLHRPASLTRAG